MRVYVIGGNGNMPVKTAYCGGQMGAEGLTCLSVYETGIFLHSFLEFSLYINFFWFV